MEYIRRNARGTYSGQVKMCVTCMRHPEQMPVCVWAKACETGDTRIRNAVTCVVHAQYAQSTRTHTQHPKHTHLTRGAHVHDTRDTRGLHANALYFTTG